MAIPARTAPEPATPGGRRALVLGLGNPLMGDDGIGWHVVEALRRDPRLPPDTDVDWGGTDLLACSSLLEGRRRVILVDAVEGGTPGTTTRLDPRSGELDERSGSAHALSLPGALRLLAAAEPSLADADLRLLGVAVGSVEASLGLSAALARHLPACVDRVLAELSDRPTAVGLATG